MSASRRHYGQFCGLAAAMDVIGERWTLLIVRELLLGPARFKEIQDNLPGIAPNLLSERLRRLLAAGIITHEPVVGDARGKLYRLTERGAELQAPLLQLSRWGLGFLTEEDAASGATSSAWGFLAVQAMIYGRPVPPVTESYEFRVDESLFHIRVADGAAEARLGPAEGPAMVATTDARTFVQIGAELLTPLNAVITGRLVIDGEPEAVMRCTQLMGLSQG
ncbi:winged helix-turn-helix transcriptional regulator [Streptomyces hydrogenans]|uniref:winged helix-turn-helix transcriptional regulator n=1 Tax=Streptomyces TaxID=1883 RepID=UPI00364F3772